ncbi:MAG: Flp family type IVb pilin [Oligoflexia bacterium]|nr:Flp family type IVb pilin [Oligoflexia bacterium]
MGFCLARSGKQRCRLQKGASLVEYALLIALLAVVCIPVVSYLGQNTNDTLNETSNGLSGSGSGPDDPPPGTPTPEGSCSDCCVAGCSL